MTAAAFMTEIVLRQNPIIARSGPDAAPAGYLKTRRQASLGYPQAFLAARQGRPRRAEDAWPLSKRMDGFARCPRKAPYERTPPDQAPGRAQGVPWTPRGARV